MADKGTFKGEIQRGWARFWALPWKWKGTALAVLAIVIIGAVASAGGGDNEIAAADPGGDETRAPEPTATPTGAPADAPTPKPTVDAVAAAEAIYGGLITTNVRDMQRLMGDLQQATENVNFADATWKGHVLQVVDDIQAVAQDMRQSESPSARWDAFNEKWVAAGGKFDEAMTLLRSGVNNASASTINDATALMLEGNALVDAATGLIPK